MRLIGGIFIGLIIAGGLSAIVGRAAADDRSSKDTASANAPLAFPAGFTEKKTHELGDVRSEFATVTEDAVKVDHFDNFINNLVTGNRDRLRDAKKRDVADLNGKINVIRKFWKDKYGKEFDPGKDAFSPEWAAVVTGEVTDSAQAVANWPVDPLTGRPAQMSREAVTARAVEAGKISGGKVKLDKGRDVALVRIGQGHGLPPLTLSMIHELPAQWRFDIPDTRTGDQIYNDLLNQLNFIATHSEDWPADINDGYRMVAHRVVMALYGVNADMKPGHRT